MLQVLHPASRQIVDHVNAETLVEEQIHHVTADESRTPGDDAQLANSHLRPSFLTVLTLMNCSSASVSPGNFPFLNAWHKSRTASWMFRLGCHPSRSAIFLDE